MLLRSRVSLLSGHDVENGSCVEGKSMVVRRATFTGTRECAKGCNLSRRRDS